MARSTSTKKKTSAGMRLLPALIAASMILFYCGCGGSEESGAGTDEPIGDQDLAEEIFRDDFNGSQVDGSVWQVATWSEHGGQTGSERCYVEDGRLNLIFTNDAVEGYLSSAIQSWDSFLYGRWEARLKPSGVPGVLNSMYTIDWGGGDGTKQEIDIEFLTYSFTDDAGEVHFAVHADGFTSFNTNPDVEIDFNPADDFHIWGFEITPEQIQWFVDDTVLLTYIYADHDIAIDAPYQLKFNAWSAEHWINGPPEANVPCIYQIDWIRFIPYSGAGPGD